jgi:hypothetical protein
VVLIHSALEFCPAVASTAVPILQKNDMRTACH